MKVGTEVAALQIKRAKTRGGPVAYSRPITTSDLAVLLHSPAGKKPKCRSKSSNLRAS